MKRFFILIGLSLTAFSSYAADTSVSIQVGQPGFYGRIDIGDFPRPEVIYTRPVVIEAPRRTRVVQEPIYLHVPPGHAKHWNKHCRKYNACGRPVYFVREEWYNDVYVPRYHHDDHDNYSDRRHDDHDNGKRGNGHGKGRGHGHGHNRD